MKFIRLWHLIAFQSLILSGMFLKAYYPLWVGKEVVLRVVPRDPRDLFRGNYVALSYSFSTLNLDSIPNDLETGKTYHFGDALYLELIQKGKFYEPAALYQERPENKLCLRVMPSYAYTHQKGGYISLQGGIESYFTNPKQATKLEELTSWQNRDSVTIGVAVKIAPNGTARISEIIF